MFALVVAVFVSAVVAGWALEMAWFGSTPALPRLDSTAEVDTREVPESVSNNPAAHPESSVGALELCRLHRD
jgi:hypothetical protein